MVFRSCGVHASVVAQDCLLGLNVLCVCPTNALLLYAPNEQSGALVERWEMARKDHPSQGTKMCVLKNCVRKRLNKYRFVRKRYP